MGGKRNMPAGGMLHQILAVTHNVRLFYIKSAQLATKICALSRPVVGKLSSPEIPDKCLNIAVCYRGKLRRRRVTLDYLRELGFRSVYRRKRISNIATERCSWLARKDLPSGRYERTDTHTTFPVKTSE